MTLTSFQRRGWEPDAVLNWLALAGWGTHIEPSAQGDQPSKTVKAPDSTTVMGLTEIINNVRFTFCFRERGLHLTRLQFELDALTHRRTILDSAKLEFLNKHHLVRARSTQPGLHALALRCQGYIKDAFPDTSASFPYFYSFLIYIACLVTARSPQWNTSRR